MKEPVATTTDIAGWLDENEPADEQDRHDFFRAVETLSEVGNYTAALRGGTLAVSGWSGQTLLLSGAKARAALLRQVEALDFADFEPETFRDVGSPKDGQAK
ncbi:hypothetical protein Msil_2210 [Methylocella silvestris BL2]|uniref:Uncharacterized protein n=1 Tax=Methylocella silvestris (strain DSM 15510 / CIP 108128 / LMG 27833 / NCIMB 13906 / BL2) TaxID=395965 RepID=B8ET06_METSB|nr:hypothetical protein [Methylocella silvestris]ACK51144.1 hypothetical protein Msil_2210 [Methylocella silvestris BL2]